MRRSLPAAALSAAALSGSVFLAPSASAHGYISTPPSRQAMCAMGRVACGPVKYEPQSVEGLKGLRSCSAGRPEFADLDDSSKPWPTTSVSGAVTFTWTFTAPHATRDYQYYLDGTLIATVDGGGARPTGPVQHRIDLGGHSGRHLLLAVWNIADTANAFYNCVDLQIGDATSGTPTTPVPGPTAPATPSPTATTTIPPVTMSSPATPSPSVPTPLPGTPSTGHDWHPYRFYTRGAIVTDRGRVYRCRIPHRSIPGWQPGPVRSLWQSVEHA